MIPQATDSFWRQLESLDFLESSQCEAWKQYAASPDATWAGLTQKIGEESLLRPQHLHQLANPEGKRVIWGNYLLMRPAYHPLGWETYEAIHAKLHRQYRLIFLPAEEPEAPSGFHQWDLMARSRTIASINSNEVVKVIDIEVFDHIRIAITQLPKGNRLSALKLPAGSREQWSTCIQSLCGDLHCLHQAGVAYGGMDPLSIRIADDSYSCRLDYLISNPILTATESVPMDLEPEEQQWILDFRAMRQARLGVPTDQRNTAYDWKSLGTLMVYLASRQSAADPEFWQAVQSLGNRLESGVGPTSDEIEQWRRSWSQSSTPLGTSKLSKAPEEPKAAPAATTIAKPVSEAGPRPVLAQKRTRHRARDRQQMWMIGLAIAAPFPLVLAGLLYYYFQHVADEPLPSQLSHRGEVEQLPDFPITAAPETDGLPDPQISDTVDPVPATDDDPNQSDATAPAASVSAPGNEDSNQSDLSKQDMPIADQLKDSDPGDTVDPVDLSLPSASLTPPPENSEDGSEDRSEDGATTMDSEQEDDTTQAEANELETDSKSDPTTEPTTSADMESPQPVLESGETGGTPTNSVTLSFEGLRDRVDLAGDLEKQFAQLAEEGRADQPLVFDLGTIDKPTATRAEFRWRSPGAPSLSFQSETAADQQFRWKIAEPDSEQPVAWLQLTENDELQLAVLPGNRKQWNALIQSQLQLEVPQDPSMVHRISFLEPRQAEKLTFQRGMIRNITWETPELAGADATIELSLSGQPLNRLPDDSPEATALNLRRGEAFYFLGEEPKLGTLGLVARLTTGKSTRFQGRLVLVTGSGLIPYDEPDKAAAISEQLNNQKVQWTNLENRIRSVRADPGEGAAKEARLNELEYLQDDADKFLEQLEYLLEQGESLYQGGLGFRLRLGKDASSPLLLESADGANSQQLGSAVGDD